MRRELAFALESRSQYDCFVGRTRSAKKSPVQLTESLIDVNRRIKRAKTAVSDGDLVNVEESMVEKEELAVVEVVNDGEESTTVEISAGLAVEGVVNGGEGSETVEGADKVYVKRIKKSKNRVECSTPNRLTPAALKENEMNAEDLGSPLRKKLELKMSKKIGLGRMPINMRELLDTGLLEGFLVYYNFDNQGKKLQGLIKGVGILCSCNSCQGTKVISPSQFEMHACKSYRHAIKHICLENGKSLLEVIEICKASASETLEVALETVISSLPVKGPSLCTDCNGSIEPSSMGNLLFCDSCLNKKEVPAEPTVATLEEVSTPKRFTRAALKENEMNAEDLGSPLRKKLELKMSKKIELGRMPINMRELLDTGLLEGFLVYYNFDNQGKKLQGLIKGVGILCSCNSCQGTKVISPSQFEMHACKSYRHAIKHICLENGKSLLEVIEICKASASETLEVALETVISSLPVKGPSLCTDCNGSIEPSSMGNLLFCDSCLNKKEVPAEPTVATLEEVSTPKRFTRAALKENEMNAEDLGSPLRKKLELKMSKKIELGRMPINMRELLDTGLLEGFLVYYNFDNQGKKLQGLIKGIGILCSCNSCQGTKVISPSQFEMHACKSYRHAIKHICLENGKSLLEVIEICKASASETLEVALETVISSFPVKGPSLCTDCNGSIEPSSMGNLLFCDSCLNKKEVPAKPTVATLEEVSKFLLSSPDVSASDNLATPVKKNRRGRKRKSENSVLKTESAGNLKLSQYKSKSKRLKRSPRSSSVQKSINKCTSSVQQSRTRPTAKNQGLHWAVFQKEGLPDGTELTYVAHGKKLLDGYKLGNGIHCSCCKTEISASQFEAHAGRASRKKPYENIYISNGVSLHEYAVSLKMKENRRCPVKFNDDLCGVCWDGGDLLLCDGCPRSFHQECANESGIPHGKWYCRYCRQSMKVDADNANAVVAGRVSGIDPIEQIATRCIRIAKTPENIDLVSCVLCRCHDFSKNVFNDRTVIVCDQCEREYHIGCLRERNMADLKALPKGKWFCSTDCDRIHSVLNNLLAREPETLPDDLLTLVKEKQKDNESETDPNPEIRFVLLSGKNATRETRKMLSQTVDIFHEGFNPILDATSGRDFIPSMVYGRKIWSQDFAGMLCALLTIDSNVVSAGTLRVFGQDIAELPIVATSKSNQKKGYFQLLFNCIERLLSSLKIKKIVLPAAEEAKSIWTNKFGFETIEPNELIDLRQTCSAMMTFKGTSMLHKEIPQVENDIANTGGIIFNPLVE